ncbi:MAG: gluconokinase [Bryobacteraceae bacterium]|nr:gluconokinase [Bryobacteraceae bacterium]
MRTLLFDGKGQHCAGFGAQLPYRVTTTFDGGVEVDGDELLGLAAEALSIIHQQMQEARRRASAVAFCAFWHSFLGVDAQGRPTVPIIHLFDTRSSEQVKRLRRLVDADAVHARTGCVLHTSYWPAKLLWLAETHPEQVRSTAAWLSFGEYLFLKLFGKAVNSTSMASGSGIWNQNRNDYDEEMLSILPVDRSQLADVNEMDQAMTELLPEYAARWPAFQHIPWFPALGDGACNNIGSGCITPKRFSLMVGTSGAMRAVAEQAQIEIPKGLWCYRVDRRRFVLGGALSNGGEVFAWMKRTLALPAEDQLEEQIAAMRPGEHGLTVLPLFAGERSTGWRPEARAAITGMGLHTGPVHIVRAALESVALRFRQLYLALREGMGEPEDVVASGGALLRSRVWTQMMADALGRPVLVCCEPEATSRGAALLALERIGAIADIRDLPAKTGEVFQCNPEHRSAYDDLLANQQRLYRKLFEEN